MMIKQMLSSLSACMILCTAVSPVPSGIQACAAAELGTRSTTRTSIAAEPAKENPIRTNQEAAKLPGLPLDDLHDVGYILQLIRQQAIDIYAESTQRIADMSGDVEILNSIPDTPLLKDSEYKPLRKSWVVFFIGTMEPLMKLLEEAFREIKSGEVILKVPPEKESQLNALIAEMGTCLASIDSRLNKCADVLNSDETANAIVAKEAAGIVQDVAKAEKIRQQTIKVFGNLGAPGTYEMRAPEPTK